MSDTAITIQTKSHKLVPGDILFCATGDLLVEEVEVDREWGGVWVTFHNGERESFPLDFTLWRVEEQQ